MSRTEEQAVIGRYMIDNYLMGVVWDDNRANQTAQLIDATAAGRIGVRVVSGSDWKP